MDNPLVEIAGEYVRLAGEMTVHRAEELKPALLDALPADKATAHLDLSQVSEIDTAGLQLLISACAEMKRRGGALQIVAASGAVTEVLTLFRQTRLLAPRAATESRA